MRPIAPSIRNTEIRATRLTVEATGVFGDDDPVAVDPVQVSGFPLALVAPATSASAAFASGLSVVNGEVTGNLDPTGLSVGVHNATVTVKAQNADHLTIDIRFERSAPPPVPVMSVTPNVITINTKEGDPDPTPNTQTVASNVGTGGDLAGPTATKQSVADYLTLTRSGTAPGQTFGFEIAVDNSTLTSAGSPREVVVHYEDANDATGAPHVQTITIVTAPDDPPGTLYPDLPYTLPTGKTFNRSTNKTEGSPLQLRYQEPADRVNLDGSLGANAVTNMTVLQQAFNDHAALGERHGYDVGATRVFEGSLVLPHNAGAGWSDLRPAGYTYNAALKVPRATTDSGWIIRTVANNVPACKTSTSGASDSTHGRVAFMGGHFRAATTTGLTFSSFNNGLVTFGSPASDQNTLAKMPLGFLLHDCTIAGNARQYYRRGFENHGGDVEVRAVTITEIHNSYLNAAGTGALADAQCLIGWNGIGRWECRYSIFHGADECVNLGGAGAAITDLDVGDIWFDHCAFEKNDAYLFNASGTDGPHDKASNIFWVGKNCYEQKRGARVAHTFCRYSGIRHPNDNQGYAITLKTGAYGQLTPNQRSEDMTFHGCWVERTPGFCLSSAYEPSGSPAGVGLPARRASFTDCFGYDLNVSPHNQSARRVVYAGNDAADDFDGWYMSHCSILTSTASTDWAVYAPANRAPNISVKDSFLPYLNGTIANSAGQGLTALNSMAPGPTWTAERNTIVPKATMPANYPATFTAVDSFASLGVTNFATGDLTLSATIGASPNPYHRDNAASFPTILTDGWNRGVSDPEMVLAELAETPTYL